MADRRVKVIFSAEIQGFKKAMDEAAEATKKTQKASEDSSKAADTYLGKMVQSANKNRDAWDTAGTTMLGFGAAAVGGLALAGKAAMDWESAWAGVTKTVDGTPEQMNELEASLRGLAKTLPSTHEEIAGVAEAAGQLGVKREAVVGFTKTMVDLGETTNLTADEAATSIAQISNVMGTMERDGSKGVERFGATLVALGNAGASTEAEILEMAKRIAGAGKLVGASESDVLALSNAMASLGIEAQLGGGVMSRVMQRMYEDVKGGGEGLDNLAKVAGVSAKDFATAFETDPVRAVDMMVKGFGRIKDEGGNVISTMGDLGIKGTEETGVILRLAGAGDILTDSLKLGDQAWQSNSALAEEAAKRYETTESKVKVAWNNIKDAAIDAGAVLLPIIAGAAESVAGLASSFAGLPAPVKGVLTILGGVAGVAALGAGAFLTLTPKILDSITAFNTLAPAGSKVNTVLSKTGKIAAGAALGLTAVGVAAAAAKPAMDKILAPTGETGDALEKFAGQAAQGAIGADTLNKSFQDLVEHQEGIGDFQTAVEKIADPGIWGNIDNIIVDTARTVSFGMVDMTSTSETARERFKAMGTQLASLDVDKAASSFQSMAAQTDGSGESLKRLLDFMPDYRKTLEEQAKATGQATDDQTLLDIAMGKLPNSTDLAKASIEAEGKVAEVAAEQTKEIRDALEEVGVAADGTIEDVDKFTEALLRAGLLNLSARDAARGFQAAIDAVGESVKTNGTTLDINTEKGRANQAALDGVAQAGFALVTANAKAGESETVLQGNLDATYQALLDSADQLGITGDEAIALAREVMHIPPGVDIKTWMGEEAKRMAEATKDALDKIPKTKEVLISIREETHRIAYEQRVVDSGGNEPTGGGLYGSHATGARLPGYLDGGQLPTSGPGTGITDGFLGISSAGVPMANVDAGEWIINRRSSDRYNRELAAINAGTFPKMPGYANGARASREYVAQSSFASAAAAPITVSAPAVTVMIGNEQLDSRMFTVAGSAMSGASRGSSYQRGGHQ